MRDKLGLYTHYNFEALLVMYTKGFQKRVKHLVVSRPLQISNFKIQSSICMCLRI